MTETLIAPEISNNEAISNALKQSSVQLLAELSKPELPTYYDAVSQPFQITKANHQTESFQVSLVFIKPDNRATLRLRLIPAHSSVTTRLSQTQAISHDPQEDEVGFKFWDFRRNLSKDTVWVGSYIQVEPDYRELGIGSALFQEGETIKDSVLERLAEVMKFKLASSTIIDNSGGWTKKQVDLLKGYQKSPVDDSFDKIQMFEKSEN